MNLAEDLQARGLVADTSAPLESILGKNRTVYLGVDPTADSMQAGNLVVILIMRRLALAGNKIVLLVGGGTGMIGDPKETAERPLSNKKVVEANKKALKAQMQQIIGTKVTVVDNADWLLKIKFVDFLRDIGKHFTINELIKRDIIRRRLETPDESISYTEFAYSLLQGYDFFELYQKKGVDFQIGGADQWINILSGVELIRRKLGKEAYAMTCPLVVDSNGKKFGKSEGNAVWLSAKKTSPFKFYQFWLNQPDDMLEKYLKMYTFLSLEDIEALVKEHMENPGARKGQETLARLVAEIVHGKEAALHAVAVTEALFGKKELGALSKEDLKMLLTEAPSVTITKSALSETALIDVLVSGGIAASKGEARRLVEGKGVALNGSTVASVDQKLTSEDFSNSLALVTKGKRDTLLLVLK